MINKKIVSYLCCVLGPRRPAYYMKYTQDRLARLQARSEKIGNEGQIRILDIGCGYAYPTTAIAHTLGWVIDGVDIQTVFWRDGLLAKYSDDKKRFGSFRACIEAPIVFFQEGRKFKELSQILGLPIQHRNLSIQTYDGLRLPFPDSYFDAVVSQDVLEHVAEMSTFWREVVRVSKSGAFIDMTYHNFYSPSGAHAPIDSEDPWGYVLSHLPLNKYSHLNRMTPASITSCAADNGIGQIIVTEVDYNNTLKGTSSEYRTEYADVYSQWENSLKAVFDNIQTENVPYESLACTSRFLIQGRVS